MKKLLAIGLIILTFTLSAQSQNCFCEKDSFMNRNLKCDTTRLSNGSMLYWNYNCEKLWLVFENTDGDKKEINALDAQLYGYKYRLGYSLEREYDNAVLFRSGCPANGPCLYHLLDKATGEVIKEFGQILCTNELKEHNYIFTLAYPYQIDAYFIDDGSTVSIPFKERLNGVIPSYQFEKMLVKEGIFEMTLNKRDTSFQITLPVEPQRVVEEFYDWYLTVSNLSSTYEKFNPVFEESENGKMQLNFDKYFKNLRTLNCSEAFIERERKSYQKCSEALAGIDHKDFKKGKVLIDLDDYDAIDCDFGNIFKWTGGMEPMGFFIIDDYNILNSKTIDFKGRLGYPNPELSATFTKNIVVKKIDNDWKIVSIE